MLVYQRVFPLILAGWTDIRHHALKPLPTSRLQSLATSTAPKCVISFPCFLHRQTWLFMDIYAYLWLDNYLWIFTEIYRLESSNCINHHLLVISRLLMGFHSEVLAIVPCRNPACSGSHMYMASDPAQTHRACACLQAMYLREGLTSCRSPRCLKFGDTNAT